MCGDVGKFCLPNAWVLRLRPACLRSGRADECDDAIGAGCWRRSWQAMQELARGRARRWRALLLRGRAWIDGERRRRSSALQGRVCAVVEEAMAWPCVAVADRVGSYSGVGALVGLRLLTGQVRHVGFLLPYPPQPPQHSDCSWKMLSGEVRRDRDTHQMRKTREE